VKNFGDKTVNAILFPFGRCRVRLGDWPDNKVDRAIAAIRNNGGVAEGEGGMPTAVDVYYFRIGKRRISLSVFDYGQSYLLGPKKLVQKIAAEIGD
jgi:hypothetical protein